MIVSAYLTQSMYPLSVARKESAGHIPGKSTLYRKHVSSRTCASPEYGHEKTMASFRATFVRIFKIPKLRAACILLVFSEGVPSMMPMISSVLIAVAVLTIAPSAHAQGKYPEKQIRLVVPTAPGGSLDIMGRRVAQQLSPMLGQPVVVENVAGAGNALGTGEVARSRPDGYTLLLGASSGVIISPVVMKTPNYDGVRDLTAISLLGLQYLVMSAGPAHPARNLKELVALLKASPGKYSYATPGVGSVNHLGGELFKAVTGVNVVHIPYKGAGPALNDVMGGHVELAPMTSASVITLVRANKIKILSSFSDERLAEYPDVPTAIESGFPGLVMSTFSGLFAPTATPRSIVNLLHAAAAKIMANPAFQKEMESFGSIAPPARSPEETQRYIAEFSARLTPIIKNAGIKEE